MRSPIPRVLSHHICGADGHPSRPDVAARLQQPTRRLGRAALKRLLLGLAPDEACHAADCYQRPGGLLHRRFTLTRPKPGGLFSVALALRSPWADVIRHRALWSPEVPQPHRRTDTAAAIWRPHIHPRIAWRIGLHYWRVVHHVATELGYNETYPDGDDAIRTHTAGTTRLSSRRSTWKSSLPDVIRRSSKGSVMSSKTR